MKLFGGKGSFPPFLVLGTGVIHRPVVVIEDVLLGHAEGFGGGESLTLGRGLRAPGLGVVAVERHQQRGHGKLAAAVDTHIDKILGVEFKIEPRAAIGNDACSEEELARGMGLALVMIEEHTGAAVHLGYDYPRGAIDNKGAALGHERHIAHVDVLFLDVADGARAGFLVHIPDHEAQSHLEKRSVGDAALFAFLDVVFRIFKVVFDEFQLGAIGKIPDREYRLEHRLQAAVGAVIGGHIPLQELFVGLTLNLDQVRHRRHFVNASETPANSLPACKRQCHSLLPRHLAFMCRESLCHNG